MLRPAAVLRCFFIGLAMAMLAGRVTGQSKLLQALERAATAGFRDTSRVEKEPAFAKPRENASFQKTLERIRARAVDPAREMTPVRLGAALESMALRAFYLSNPSADTPHLSFLLVETVRPNTPAAAVGIKGGMEVTAIQGRRIHGMTDNDLLETMNMKVKNTIVLTVREPPHVSEKEIQLPLWKSSSIVVSE